MIIVTVEVVTIATVTAEVVVTIRMLTFGGGCHGIMLTACMGPRIRYDGRWCQLDQISTCTRQFNSVIIINYIKHHLFTKGKQK